MDRIFDICYNIAGDIQPLCSALWDTTSCGDHIVAKQVPFALEQIFAPESKGYETTLKIISGQQLRFLTGGWPGWEGIHRQLHSFSSNPVFPGLYLQKRLYEN